MDSFPIVRRKDETAHGEYRTRRLVLELLERYRQASVTGAPYRTVLMPAPAAPGVAHPAADH